MITVIESLSTSDSFGRDQVESFPTSTICVERTYWNTGAEFLKVVVIVKGNEV